MHDTPPMPPPHVTAGSYGTPVSDRCRRTPVALLLAMVVTANLAAQSRPAQSTDGSEPATRSASEPRRGVQLAWRDHPSVRSGRYFQADFELRLQGDARHAGDNPADFERAQLRRARVGVHGEVLQRVQFSVERALTLADALPDAAPRRTSPWKDVWVEWEATKAIQMRAGRFKVPFGLDQLTGISQNDFVHRSLGATYLAPGRDTGAMLHGRLFDRGLHYWAALFAHDGDNPRTSTIRGGDRTFAARVTAAPLRLHGYRAASLDIGAAVAVSRVSGDSPVPNGLRGRTVVSDFLFFEPVFVHGNRRRMELDIDWMTGPLDVRAEFTDVRDERRGQGLGDQTLPDARARAWYVSGAWILTGQEKRRPLTLKSFGAGRPAVGVVEAVARLERIWFDSVGGGVPSRSPRSPGLLANGEYAATVGANWHPTRFTTLQFGVVWERLDDLERSPVPDRTFWSPMLRMQVTL